MVDTLFHWLLATFLFNPIQAQIEERLRTAGAPIQVVEQVRSCATTAAPAFVRKASDDWVWGATTVIRVASGMTDPLDVVAAELPPCRAAIEAIRRRPAA
jgi:hypothetical protein